MKNDYNSFQILKTIEEDASVSQRMLSSKMAINVASVNFALKGLISKGFVKKVGENCRRTKYYVTDEGLREKTHIAYRYYCQNIPYYKEVRNNIEARIAEAANGINTNIAIYGISELSETTYMVVSKMGLKFLGFFIENTRITNEKIFGYSVQELNRLQGDHKCLLLLTEEFPVDKMNGLDTKNVDTLNLVE
ncbi:MAG: winged helix-turn-helix transcriptional regulator [Gammaproteobacteria bacterium]|nr:winged helix-turn-helix transcriptional regulator [Gammaproteobacteria bacterium]